MKNYHPGILVRPCCSFKAGCVGFGSGRYKCCGVESEELGCMRLHSCCDVTFIDTISNQYHNNDTNVKCSLYSKQSKVSHSSIFAHRENLRREMVLKVVV